MNKKTNNQPCPKLIEMREEIKGLRKELEELRDYISNSMTKKKGDVNHVRRKT